MNIVDALAKLDPSNDNHWTTDGQPRLDVMKDLVGAPVSRGDISLAAKGFSRKNLEIDLDAAKTESTGDNLPAEEVVQPAPVAEPLPPIEDEATSNNVVTETPVVTGNSEADPEAEAEAELAEARAAYEKAQLRFNKAVKEMDKVILARNHRASNGRNQAEDVKAYQKAQNAQRAAIMESRKAIALTMKANKLPY